MSEELSSEQLSSKELAVLDKKIKKLDRMTARTYRHILDSQPPKSIVKYHKFGKFEYLPITAVERLLDGLFDGWTLEILREGHVLNGFYVVVRLTVKIPNSEKRLVADGIGFAEFQTAKGAAPTDFSKIIQGAGVLAIPKAKAEALKNAAKSLGALFGRNLARDDDQSQSEEDVVSKSRSKIANTLQAINEATEESTDE
jgi:hypothetical protein